MCVLVNSYILVDNNIYISLIGYLHICEQAFVCICIFKNMHITQVHLLLPNIITEHILRYLYSIAKSLVIRVVLQNTSPPAQQPVRSPVVQPVPKLRHVQYSTVQYSTVQYSTYVYSRILYCTNQQRTLTERMGIYDESILHLEKILFSRRKQFLD